MSVRTMAAAVGGLLVAGTIAVSQSPAAAAPSMRAPVTAVNPVSVVGPSVDVPDYLRGYRDGYRAGWRRPAASV
ncbi:hypothetical protein ACFQX7_35795 [Luedemannella flava]